MLRQTVNESGMHIFALASHCFTALLLRYSDDTVHDMVTSFVSIANTSIVPRQNASTHKGIGGLSMLEDGYKRMGIGEDSSKWRISHLNFDFQVSS
jgi:hypothetical protein